MADLKRFLDFPGLAEYDRLIKEYIKNGSNEQSDKFIKELALIAEKDKAQDEAIEKLQDAVDILNGDESVEGSVAQQVKDAVTDLIDGAPEALDTLKEIADWIGDDETGTAALINRVADNEAAIAELQAQDLATKDYIDEQDQMYFDLIDRIEELQVNSLFPLTQAEGKSAAEAIEGLKAGQALKLDADQVIAEDLTIDKPCYIDANGATFEGTLTIPAAVDVIIENAVFSKPVVMV